FLAIVLVGVGTQCLFSSGSIALLKAMKRNKWYYYKLNHFTGVSGMLYRMKQNAAGLANICILSTGVLLVISITACLWTGVDNSVKNRYPSQISVNGNNLSDEQIESYVQLIQQSLSDQGLTPETFTDERAITATVLRHQNRFYAPDENTAVTELRNSEGIYILTADDYQIWTGESLSVEKGTAVVIPEKKDDTFAYETVEIGEKVWKAQAMTSDVLQKEEGDVIVTTYLIFSDQEEVQTVLEALGVTEYVGTSWSCDMDFHLSEEEQITVGHRIDEALAASQADSAGVWVEIREEQRPGMEALYGAVLFFGIFVGLLFLMGTVMIIYYKQVSEGYDDRERFQIMQKVGMSRREVKKCIHSQVLTVFFLPLVTAMVHTVVAFPFMTKIMRLLNFSNVHAFMIATGITIAVFAVVYVIVYAVTARTYYNIVEE
ncbi:MAG: ABC transporter permease, partial [Lachnospiraceae bacterium]|nr:ABC transporter permease [Lachnospiraceae bacterium]